MSFCPGAFTIWTETGKASRRAPSSKSAFMIAPFVRCAGGEMRKCRFEQRGRVYDSSFCKYWRDMLQVGGPCNEAAYHPVCGARREDRGVPELSVR